MIVCVILISACNKGVIYITEGVVTWFWARLEGSMNEPHVPSHHTRDIDVSFG